MQENAQFLASAVAPNGGALAVWQDRDHNDIRYANRPPGGSFSAPATLEDLPGIGLAYAHPTVALNASGAAVVAWIAKDTVGDEHAIRASYRPAGGSFSPPVTLDPMDEFDNQPPDTAISPGGKAVVVWRHPISVGVHDYFTYASVHGPTGGFGPGQKLNGPTDSGSLGIPQVAMDTAGNTIAVFTSERPGGPGLLVPIQWAYLGASETSFTAPQDLESGEGGGPRSPDVAFAADGRATVVWGLNEGVQAAEQVAAGGSFAPARTVSGALEDYVQEPALALDASGNAVVAYRAGIPPNHVIRYATAPAGGAFAPSAVLSSPGGSTEVEIAGDAAGNVAAVWSRYDGTRGTVEGSYRPAAGSFAAAKTLSKASYPAGLPSVGLDASGAATAVWITSNFYGVAWYSTYGGSSTGPKEDGGGGGGPPPASPVPAPPAPEPPSAVAPPPIIKKKPLKCRKGFKKKTVKGKAKCVQVKKKRRR